MSKKNAKQNIVVSVAGFYAAYFRFLLYCLVIVGVLFAVVAILFIFIHLFEISGLTNSFAVSVDSRYWIELTFFVSLLSCGIAIAFTARGALSTLKSNAAWFGVLRKMLWVFLSVVAALVLSSVLPWVVDCLNP